MFRPPREAISGRQLIGPCVSWHREELVRVRAEIAQLKLELGIDGTGAHRADACCVAGGGVVSHAQHTRLDKTVSPLLNPPPHRFAMAMQSGAASTGGSMRRPTSARPALVCHPPSTLERPKTSRRTAMARGFPSRATSCAPHECAVLASRYPHCATLP